MRDFTRTHPLKSIMYGLIQMFFFSLCLRETKMQESKTVKIHYLIFFSGSSLNYYIHSKDWLHKKQGLGYIYADTCKILKYYPANDGNSILNSNTH